MESFISERGRDSEVAAVDGSTSSGRGERCDVAGGAANFFEQSFAVFSFGSLRERDIARRRFRGAHEASEVIDVEETVGAGRVIGFASGIAEIGDFVGLEAIRDAHFVEIGVSREREQAGMLIFPAEAAHAGFPRNFHDGNVKGLATYFALALLALILSEVEQCLVRKGFPNAIPQNI